MSLHRSPVGADSSPADDLGEGADRFAFGANWQRYARTIDEGRINAATAGMQALLRTNTLAGCRLLDIGCGSGLSSFAALCLGARVYALDYDVDAVATTRALLERRSPGGPWQVEQGSVLDRNFMESLGSFDVVYSWGVLHHTGAMWDAIDAAALRVGPEGTLAISIYNDQGGASRRWAAIKRVYVRGGPVVRAILVAGVGVFFELRAALIRAMRLQNPLPFKDWRKRREDRGMSIWHDLVDWVGGYPFEVARPEEVLHFLRDRGFTLIGLKTCAGGLACNEYLFSRQKELASAADTSCPTE